MVEYTEMTKEQCERKSASGELYFLYGSPAIHVFDRAFLEREALPLARQVCRGALDPREVLRQVGLEARMNNFPAQLSGGEQQRVSIARALCKNPALLLCDEPTGALDSQTSAQVLALLLHLSREYHTTVVVITHNAAIADLATHVIRLRSGSVVESRLNEHPARVEDIAW